MLLLMTNIIAKLKPRINAGATVRNTIGRRTLMDDETGFVAYVYDIRGRVTDQQRVFDGEYEQFMAGMSPHGYATAYDFDAADRPIRMVYPDGEELFTNYTLRGLLEEQTSNIQGLIVSAEYNVLGQKTRQEAGNGVVTTYAYHSAQISNNCLMQMTVANTDDTLMSFAYRYDDGGNIRTIHDATQGVNGETIAYNYDHLDRLKTASASGENGYTRVYDYDEVGNITKKGPLDQEESYLYEGDQPHAVTEVGNDRYWYDENGNMALRIEGGIVYTQTWNAYNKLDGVEWKTNDVPCRTEFVYDGDGNRLLKVENMLSQFGATGNMERATLYVGGIYERQFNTTTSPVGARVEGVIPEGIDPITTCNGVGDSPTDYGFTGQRNESSFGLQDFNARYYSPRLGRFVSPDTLIPDPANSQDFNRYMMVRGNLLNYIDPSGHDPLDDDWEAEWQQNHCDPNQMCTVTDTARQHRLFSLAYAGPISGSRTWTDADWHYFTNPTNRYVVYQSTSERNSLKDFSSAISRLAESYVPGEESQFVSALALLYAGWPYDPNGNIWSTNVNGTTISFQSIKIPAYRRYFPNHAMSGFAGSYHHKGNENTHHFVGHLILGYHWGLTANDFATNVREIAQSQRQKFGETVADIDMGLAGGHMGHLLANSDVSIAQFGPLVQEQLSVNRLHIFGLSPAIDFLYP